MKKLLAFLMVVLFAATAMAETYEHDGLTYKLYLGDNPTASVISCDHDVTVAIIPETINVNEQEFVVTKIEDEAFGDCTKLTEVQIPNTVTSIVMYAFFGCKSLTEIRIPASVTHIGTFVFGKCSSLKEIIVDENNANFTSKDGVLFNKDMSYLHAYPAGKEDRSYSIPEGVKTLWQSSFYSCSQLSEVNLPNTIETIGNEAFSGSGLTEIKIPKSVTAIIVKAFWNCKKLARFIVDENNPNYSSVDGVLFDKNVSSIIAYPEGRDATSYSIPSGVAKISEATFEDCENLTQISIPNSVTSIEDAAFEGCIALTELMIPDAVTSIGSWSFDNCISLTTIQIPKSVTRIARLTDSPLTTIYYNTVDPITYSTGIFTQTTYDTATLYVAPGGKEKASVTEPWKYFNNIEEKEFTGIEEIMVDFDTNLPISVYDLNGVTVASSIDNLAPGLYIIRQGNKSKKIAIK